MKTFKYFIFLIFAVMLTACASPKRGDIEYAPALPVRNISQEASDSIFQTTSAWFLLEDIKPRHVGDMLTVTLREKTDAKKNANTETTKETDNAVAAATILGAPISASDRNLLLTKLKSNYEFTGEADSQQSNSLTGSVTVTVVEVLANGNLVVQGEKWININQGDEYIRLRGIVRSNDIGADNTISSERVANAQIEYSGQGTFAEVNEPGWLTKFFNSKWMPF